MTNLLFKAIDPHLIKRDYNKEPKAPKIVIMTLAMLRIQKDRR